MQKRTEESLLSSGRFKFFPAAGHARSQLFCPPIPPNQLSRRKQVLCFFLDARKKRSPRILRPSLSVPKAAPSSKAGGGRCLIVFYSCISAKHARRFTACAVPCAPRGTAPARTGRSGRGHRAQRRGFARPRRYPGRSPCWRGRSRAGDRSADAAGSRR